MAIEAVAGAALQPGASLLSSGKVLAMPGRGGGAAGAPRAPPPRTVTFNGGGAGGRGGSLGGRGGLFARATGLVRGGGGGGGRGRGGAGGRGGGGRGGGVRGRLRRPRASLTRPSARRLPSRPSSWTRSWTRTTRRPPATCRSKRPLPPSCVTLLVMDSAAMCIPQDSGGRGSGEADSRAGLGARSSSAAR